MRKAIGLAVVFMLLAAAPCLAQKVIIDYDEQADLESYETFSWGKTSETSLAQRDPLMHSRIKNAIEHQLTTGGMIEVEADPDVYVTYHTNTEEEVQLHTTNYGYNYGPGWHWDPYWSWGGAGMSSSTTTAYTYTRGTLIVDIWDAKAEKLIFRGSAEGILKEKPEKLEKQIYKFLAKMSSRFDSMRRKDLKK